MRIHCIVEGHGELQALPVLLRRIVPGVLTEKPWRVAKDRFLKGSELERTVQAVADLAEPDSVILVLIDADASCPAELGRRILTRAQAARPDLRFVVALANPEFESWFLAAARSLRGKRGLPPSLEPPPNPEAVRGAKEWIEKHRAAPYSPTIDQPAFAQLFDLEEARANSPSFRRFEQRVLELVS